ncbi:MAG: hypothetical protein AAFQ84_11765, partial [Pseudomonadota bacterium]
DKEQTGVEWISGVIQSLGEMPFGWARKGRFAAADNSNARIRAVVKAAMPIPDRRTKLNHPNGISPRL